MIALTLVERLTVHFFAFLDVMANLPPFQKVQCICYITLVLLKGEHYNSGEKPVSAPHAMGK